MHFFRTRLASLALMLLAWQGIGLAGVPAALTVLACSTAADPGWVELDTDDCLGEGPGHVCPLKERHGGAGGTAEAHHCRLQCAAYDSQAFVFLSIAGVTPVLTTSVLAPKVALLPAAGSYPLPRPTVTPPDQPPRA